MSAASTARTQEAKMPSQSEPASRSWHRYLRFSIRGLIVAVPLVGGWLGWIAHTARIQREAIATIERAGGFVRYDWEGLNNRAVLEYVSWPPEWLVELVEVDYFVYVKSVLLSPFEEVTETDVEQIGRLTGLESLSVSLSEASLVHLKDLKNLTKLDLQGTQVSDAGLVCLKELTKLSEASPSCVSQRELAAIARRRPCM
jgi:hypothetical protein